VEDLFRQPGPFRVAEIAAALRCSRRYVHKIIKAGTIKAGRVGRDFRISAREARRLARMVCPDAHDAHRVN